MTALDLVALLAFNIALGWGFMWHARYAKRQSAINVETYVLDFNDIVVLTQSGPRGVTLMPDGQPPVRIVLGPDVSTLGLQAAVRRRAELETQR